MSKFPNYRLVEFSEGVVAKVAPLRIHRDESHKALAVLAFFMDGETTAFMRAIPDLVPALRLSLLENHAPAECEKLLDALDYSTDQGSAFMTVILALIGRDRPADNPEADDK